jgi:hypothetical protein
MHLCIVRRQASIGFPDAQVNDDVWVCINYSLCNCIVFVWLDDMHHGASQSASRRVGIDANNFTYPCLLFKQSANTRAKFSTDAGDYDSAATH